MTSGAAAAEVLRDEGEIRIAARDRFGDLERRHAHAEKALRDLAGADQLVDHRFDHVHRDREADARELPLAHRVAAAGCDRGVHADHAAAHVGERAAGVAGIDRRIDLDEVLVVDVLEAGDAAEARHDPLRHREAEVEGAAEGEDHVALLERVAVAADRGMDEGAVDPHHRDVGAEVHADEFGLVGRAVVQLDLDAARAVDHVRIGDDVPVGVVDPPRARREVGLHAGAAREAAARADVDDRGLDCAGDVAVGLVELVEDRAAGEPLRGLDDLAFGAGVADAADRFGGCEEDRGRGAGDEQARDPVDRWGLAIVAVVAVMAVMAIGGSCAHGF